MLSAENHAWFNKQSKEAQDEMNRRFQEYKKCEVVLVDDLDIGFSVKAAEMIFEPEPKKEKYNRAKVNQEFRRKIKDEMER